MKPRLHHRLKYMATTVCATLSAIVGTVASNCTSCSSDFGLEW